MSIKEMVKGNKKVYFEFARKGELWYKTECGFVFPVPFSDMGDGTFNKEDKAMFFMRYIRKQLDAIKKETNVEKKTVKGVLEEHGIDASDVIEYVQGIGERVSISGCRVQK